MMERRLENRKGVIEFEGFSQRAFECMEDIGVVLVRLERFMEVDLSGNIHFNFRVYVRVRIELSELGEDSIFLILVGEGQEGETLVEGLELQVDPNFVSVEIHP